MMSLYVTLTTPAASPCSQARRVNVFRGVILLLSILCLAALANQREELAISGNNCKHAVSVRNAWYGAQA